MRSCLIQWFKHDADASQDAKLQNVLLDYGLEGYGLYWYCIELIAGELGPENITFELEHDARILARNTGSTQQKVQEMMQYFVKIGLFECSNNTITCLKLGKRLDKSMTSNPQMRDLIGKIRSHDSVMIKPDLVMQDKIRLDKNKDTCDKSRINNQSVVDAFHDCLSMLPKVQVLNESRKTAIKNFFKKRTKEKGEDFTIDNFKAYLDYIANNCKWMLQLNPKAGGGFYKPRDFDYILTDRCYIAVKESRFDDMGNN